MSMSIWIGGEWNWLWDAHLSSRSVLQLQYMLGD